MVQISEQEIILSLTKRIELLEAKIDVLSRQLSQVYGRSPRDMNPDFNTPL